MPPKPSVPRPVPRAEAERRLGPVLDILFTPATRDNPRPALKLAAQAEAKRPRWPAARALRALALRRLGRAAEADALAAEVLEDVCGGRVGVDEDAAVKLHLYFREVPRREVGSARAYEAVAKAVGSVEAWERAFFWWLRARDYGAAQKVATKLQKAPAGRGGVYALWGALAVWLGNRGKGDRMLESLAGALVKKGIAAGGGADEVRFAVRILCEVADFVGAAKVLKPLVGAEGGKGMDAVELALLRADVEYRIGDRVRVMNAYRGLLESGDADDWVSWLRLLDVTDAEVASIIIANLSEKNPRLRGPFLAGLELYYREKDWPALCESIESYFDRFGSKRVCCDDLRSYILALEAAEPGMGTGLVKKLGPNCTKDGQREADEAVRHLHASWLRLWLGCMQETPEELVSCYERMLVDAPLESTERQPGDDYILLAAHKILPEAKVSGSTATAPGRYDDPAVVVQALALVERALEQSPYNFDFNLLAVLLYKSIGAGHFAAEKWMALDVKHIQTATLGHLIVQPMLELGVHEAFPALDRAFHGLWAECDRDIPESVSRALGDDSVNAGLEFIECRDRVVRSRSLVRAMLCSVLVKLNALGDKETFGTQQAVSELSDDLARFVPQDLEVGKSGSLIANEDMQCMDFWELNRYDKERCRRDPDAPGTQDGIPISGDLQTLLLVELVSLRCLTRRAARQDEAKDDLKALSGAWGSLNEETRSAHPSKAYLVALILGEEDPGTSISFLEDELRQLRADAIGGGLSPGSFARAGLLVYETLTLTAMAFGSMKKQRALLFKEAALDVCTGVEELLTVIVDEATRLKWANEWGPEGMDELTQTCHKPSAALLLARVKAIRFKLKMRAI